MPIPKLLFDIADIHWLFPATQGMDAVNSQRGPPVARRPQLRFFGRSGLILGRLFT